MAADQSLNNVFCRGGWGECHCQRSATVSHSMAVDQRWPESLFSDSDSTPLPKFLNPGPAILQIWESDSCSDSGYNHRSYRNLPCFYLRNDRTDSCNYRYWKVTPDPGPVFHKFSTLGPDPGPKEKRRILPESTPVIRIRSHLCCGLTPSVRCEFHAIFQLLRDGF